MARRLKRVGVEVAVHIRARLESRQGHELVGTGNRESSQHYCVEQAAQCGVAPTASVSAAMTINEKAGGEVFLTYIKPFDVFANRGKTGDWLAALDYFRNWLVCAA